MRSFLLIAGIIAERKGCNPSSDPRIYSELPGFRFSSVAVGSHVKVDFKDVTVQQGAQQQQSGLMNFDNLRFTVSNYGALFELNLPGADSVLVRVPWRQALPPARIYMSRNQETLSVPTPIPQNMRIVSTRANTLAELASDDPAAGNPMGTKYFLSASPNAHGDYDLWLKVTVGIQQHPYFLSQCALPANALGDGCIYDNLHVYLWRN